MTSDAKIGLLLGLVFIFIIAFVINGLPRFRNALDSNEPALEKNFVQDNPIGAKERNAQGVIENPTGGNENHPAANEETAREDGRFNTPWSDTYSVAQGNRSEVTEVEQSFNEQTSEQTSDWQAVEPQVATDTRSQEEIRDQRGFPFPTDRSDRSLPALANETQGQRGSIPVNPDIRRGGTVSQGDQVQTAQQTQSNPPVQANQTNWPKTYVVKEGDSNLAKISKKFYGGQEGNRLVNINRIFEANKPAIKSPDKIFVGQTIVIPQPAAPVGPQPAAPVGPQPASVLSGGMFQQVSQVGGGSTGRQETAAVIQDTDGYRWYEVKEDDSLWKIADVQLGKGTRLDEIKKMNTDILKNETKLKPGMKLRLPAK